MVDIFKAGTTRWLVAGERSVITMFVCNWRVVLQIVCEISYHRIWSQHLAKLLPE